MRYPITKFLEGHGQWWYVNAVFNEPPKERNRMVLDPANGVAKGEGGCLFCSTSDQALLKNTIEIARSA